MSVIAEFSIPASQFILGRALQETSELEVQLEQMVPTGEAMIPYFWVLGEGQAQFRDILRSDAELSDFEAVDELDGRTLYRVSWDPAVDTFVQAIHDHEVVLLEAGGDDESWAFQLRFPDTHDLSTFHTDCKDAGVDVTINNLYNPIEPTTVETRELTDAQRTLIKRAYEEGYFDVPRRITLAELAEKVGVSDQAVNERLRRGLSSLIGTTLKSEDE